MKCITVVLSVFLFVKDCKAQNWDYQHQAKWYDDFNECRLTHQSPIEINAAEAKVSYFMPPLEFHNYNVACSDPATITNNGQTASIDLSEMCNRPQITGGPLPYRAIYEAMSFHFHWGSKDQHGSEHIVNGERFSLEAHIVNKNTKYSSMEEAGKHLDGLAVEAIFFRANGHQQRTFDGLQKVVHSLKNVRKYNTSSRIENATLSELFGNINTSRFFTYQGSLTTPPCSQAVTWLIFPQVIEINPDQMHQFRLLANAHRSSLVNNYRFIQPKDGRRVYFRRNITAKDIVTTGPATPGPLDKEFYDYINAI